MEALISAFSVMFKGKFLQVLLFSSLASIVRFTAIVFNIGQGEKKRTIGEKVILVLFEVPVLFVSALIGMMSWVITTSAGMAEWEKMAILSLTSILGFTFITSIVKISFDRMLDSALPLAGGFLKTKIDRLNTVLQKKE